MTDTFAEKNGLGADGDAFYEELMAAHEGLDETQGHALNARLVLLMANEIGDMAVLAAILRTARKFND
jgi:hypothetical protein